MILKNNFWQNFGVFTAIMVITGVGHASLFSKEGLVQNVQDYSVNPFYNTATGTVSTPTMVYVNGPKLAPNDCERAVRSVVENVCSDHNNCRDTKLATVRPDIMVQLSLLPKYNYATSCVGFIDSVYDAYVNRYNYTNNAATSTGFPSVTTASVTATTQKSNLPKWKQEYNERDAELRALHAMTAEPVGVPEDAEFPKTFQDLSFQEQNEIKKQGYEPYKDAQAYVPLSIKRDDSLYKTTAQVKAEAYSEFISCLQGYENALKTADKAYQDAYAEWKCCSEKKTWATNVIAQVEDATGNVITESSIPLACLGDYVGDNYVFYDRTKSCADGLTAANCSKDPGDSSVCYITDAGQADIYKSAKDFDKKPNCVSDISTQKNALNKAIKEDHHSPCICTKGNRFRDEVLVIMGVKCGTGSDEDKNTAAEPAGV